MYIVILHVYLTYVLTSSLRQKILYSFYSLTTYQQRGLYRKGREKSVPIVTNNQYRLWLKIAANMKLSSDAYVLSITYEGLTNFQSFMYSDCNNIESLSKACSKDIDRIISDVPNGIAAENDVPGTNISTISIRRLVVATNAVKYYTVIGRIPEFDNIHYVNVLGGFRTDYDA